MINFFRKIRKQLADDNKPLKYMRYAVGEIVLVVIGILIALSINNWNEGNKELFEENKLIENLRQEFQNNLKNIDTANKELDSNISDVAKLLVSMGDLSAEQFTGEKLDSLLIECFALPKWKRSHINIREMESSGKLGRLRNEDLKHLIYDYLGEEEIVRDFEKRGEESLRTLVSYITENGSWRELDKYLFIKEGGSILMPSNDHLLKDFKFENVIDDYLVNLRIRKRDYLNFRKHIQKIIESSRE